ncbi:MAG: ABC transporter substrate-binding protein, partial [Erysipelotrichales bacterium]|nr:ABC transporter substrate-binding protein [Erysipelotrichales bacterium]
MKKAISIMLVVLMVFGLAACNGKKDPDPETKETIKIAVIDAFTGDKAVNGQYSKEGIELALAEINEKGVLGRQVELIYEDGQGKETETTNAFQKVTAEHKLDAVILDKYSSDVLAVEQFVAENGLPTFCQGSSIKIEGSSTKNLYSTRRSDAGAGGSVVAFIKEQGVKKVAILHSPDALGQSMGKVVVDGLAKIGVEVVSD